MKKILIFFCLISLFVPAMAMSQEEDAGGSPYSVFGIGDNIYYSSNRTYSMGILGTSLFGNYVNSFNPAALAKLRFTDLTFGMGYGLFKTQNANSASELSDANVLGFNIGIPISQGSGWVMGLGFNPVTIVNSKIELDGNLEGQNYEQTYSSKGGLSRVSIGMSYTLWDKLTLGAEYNYGFGEIRTQNFINFRNASFINTNIKKELDFNKSYVKGGAILEVGKLFRSISLRDFTVGFAYQFAFTANTSEDGIFVSSISIDTTGIPVSPLNIPQLMSFGMTNVFSGKYVVSADFTMQDWSGFNENPVQGVSLGSTYRAGLGMEIMPSRDATSFLGSLSYRLGGYYEKAFFSLNGNDINSWGARLGVNIPMSEYSSIDLGVNYSERGTTSNGLIKDKYLNFTASLNFGELWFIRAREEEQ